MKNFLKLCWIVLCILLSITFIICSLSSFIKPSSFSFISLAAYSFPFAFAAQILFCLVNFFVQKTLAIFMLLLLPAAWTNSYHTFAVNTAKPWQNEKDSNTLRVMTWNVQYFKNAWPQDSPQAQPRVEMYKIIQKYNPDILCVQEYFNYNNWKYFTSSKDELAAMGYKINFLSNDNIIRADGGYRTQGVAIFSKVPFTASGRTGLQKKSLPENLIYTDVLLDKKPVRIFTAHLSSYHLFTDTARAADKYENIYNQTYNRKRTIQYKLREAEKMHEAEVSVIRHEIEQSPFPAIFCGDLNTVPASYSYRFLKDGMQDAFLQKGAGIGATFYKLIPTLRIDVCFVDSRLQVKQCYVEQKKLSDHYPLITDVAWK